MSEDRLAPSAGARRLAIRLLPPIVTDAIRHVLAAQRAARVPHALPLPEAVLPTEPEKTHTIEEVPTPVVPTARPEWEIVEDSDALWSSLAGWDHDSVVATQIAKWSDFLKSVEGTGVLGRSHEASYSSADLATHNTLMSFGYALGRAIAGRSSASLLDWGGGLGHYRLYAGALFPDVTFDFHVKDFGGLCEAGARLLPDVTFHVSDETALARRYDFVLSSSAVHYTRDPYSQMKKLCAATQDRILITRTPVLERRDDTLIVQRPHHYGYLTEYAGWAMNRHRLIASVEANGFELERQFLIGEQPYLPDLDEPAHYAGFLFRRR